MNGRTAGDDGDEAEAVRIGGALPADAPLIAQLHVATWRNAYAGILDDAVLLRLRPSRLGPSYARQIRAGRIVRVARAPGGAPVGFAIAGRARPGAPGAGEIEMLYVADDWQGRGIGRALLADAAARLASRGCGSVFVWVLSANPSRFFYARLGGALVARGDTTVGGASVPQLAFLWDPIARLRSGPASSAGGNAGED